LPHVQERPHRRPARRPGRDRLACHRPGLGPDETGFQGRPLLRACERRLLLRSDPGGRSGHAPQLPGRSAAADGGLRRRRRRGAGPLRREGAGLRAPRRGDPRRRLGGRPGHLSHPAEAALLRVPPRGRPPARPHEHLRRGHARAGLPLTGDPPLPSRARLLLDPHADHHGERRGGGRAALPRVDARPRQPPPDGRRSRRLRGGLLRPARVPDRLGAAQRRDLLPGALARVHLRADLPRGELEHQPPPRGVLDGRAGDRLRRPERRRRPGGGVPPLHLPRRARGARR